VGGDLDRATNGKWMTQAPTHCPSAAQVAAVQAWQAAFSITRGDSNCPEDTDVIGG